MDAKLQSSKKEALPYRCHWVDVAPVLTGKMDHVSWKSAERLTDLVIAGSDQPALSKTSAYLLWNDTHLFFAAVMQDTDVYGLHEGHDPPFGGDDLIELFVKPNRSAPAYWEFHVSPRGATRDYFYARRNAGPDERWQAYNSGMQAAVFVDGTLNDWSDVDRGWTAEVAIPWSAFNLTGGKPKPNDVWTFMIARYDYSVHLEEGLELSASCVLPKVNFHLHEYYQDIVFQRRTTG